MGSGRWAVAEAKTQASGQFSRAPTGNDCNDSGWAAVGSRSSTRTRRWGDHEEFAHAATIGSHRLWVFGFPSHTRRKSDQPNIEGPCFGEQGPFFVAWEAEADPKGYAAAIMPAEDKPPCQITRLFCQRPPNCPRPNAVRLIDDLATTLLNHEEEFSLSQEWLDEIERRSAAIESGAAETVDWETVRRDLFRRVGLEIGT